MEGIGFIVSILDLDVRLFLRIEYHTFHKFAEQWKAKKATQVKEYSIKKSCERLEKHVYPYIAKVPVKDLNRQQIIDFLRPLEECGKLDTLKRIVSLINQILDFAVDCGCP